MNSREIIQLWAKSKGYGAWSSLLGLVMALVSWQILGEQYLFTVVVLLLLLLPFGFHVLSKEVLHLSERIDELEKKFPDA